MEIRRQIAVIDCDSVAYSIGNPNKVYHNGIPLKENGKFVYVDKTEEELRQSADLVMSTILRNCGATEYIGYIKGSNTTSKRLLVNPDYKAHRNKEAPWWWECVKYYLIHNWQVLPVDNIEVDDMVNITRLNIPNSFIVAIDGDLLELEGTHFKWRSKNSLVGEWVTTTQEEALIKFWTDMIVGQVGDNIKGIPGCGPKFVENLFKGVKSEAYPFWVLAAYIDKLGVDKGIKEYYKNYVCLKIEDQLGEIVLPIPQIVLKIN